MLKYFPIKSISLLFILFIFTINVNAQKEIITYNPDSKIISSDSLFLYDFKKYRIWGEESKTSITYKVHEVISEIIIVDYKEIVKQLKRLRIKSIIDDKPIFIKYDFFNDICPNNKHDEATLLRIREKMLHHVNQQHDFINYVHIFQKGVRVQYKREFVAIDNFEYFKNNIFNQPCLCGTMAVIYPDNTYKIHYGERAAFDLEK